MKIISRIGAFLAGRRPRPLHEWFFASFDDKTVRLRIEPRGKQVRFQEFAWEKVIRVRFEEEDMWWSDRIHVYTNEEGYVIPIEARGGAELWSEILRRKLSDGA
jgi:hypothetical protein